MSEEVTVCELSKEKKEISLGEKTFYNKLLEKKLKTVYITTQKWDPPQNMPTKEEMVCTLQSNGVEVPPTATSTNI